MVELIRNYGGEPIQAPSMREVPLTDQREALAFGETLLAGDWDALILLTGVGTRMLIAACATRWPKDEVVKALGRLTLVCRGPKPIARSRRLASRRRSGCPSRIPGATCFRSWTASSRSRESASPFRSTARATKSCWPGFRSAEPASRRSRCTGGRGTPVRMAGMVSLYYLIRLRQQRRRDREAQRLGGLAGDGQLALRG